VAADDVVGLPSCDARSRLPSGRLGNYRQRSWHDLTFFRAYSDPKPA
jgi:hypothetical protein